MSPESQKPASGPGNMMSDSFAVLAEWSRHLGARGLSPETIDTYRSYVARALTKVRPEHISLEAAELYFAEAKGDRDYAVPLGREGLIAARHLLADARTNGRQTLLGVGYGRFWEWVREAKQAAHIDSSPHWLRRTFGSYTARHVDPEVWRQLMGHQDLSQWTRYVGTERQAVRDGVARVLRSA